MASSTQEKESSPPSSINNKQQSLPTCLIVLGMSGSRKSTLVQRLTTHLYGSANRPYVINLDDRCLDVSTNDNSNDIHRSVSKQKEITMKNIENNCANGTITSTRFDQVLGVLEKKKSDYKYVIIDIPGQTEVFTGSASGATLIKALSSTYPTIIVYVIDTLKCISPVTFMSTMMSACSLLYKSRLPFVLVFNKTDIRDAKFAKDWMTDFGLFEKSLDSESSSFMGNLTRSLSLFLDKFYQNVRSVTMSGTTGDGIDEFFKDVDDAVKEYHEVYKPQLDKQKKEKEEKSTRKKSTEMKERSNSSDELATLSRRVGEGDDLSEDDLDEGTSGLGGLGEKSRSCEWDKTSSGSVSEVSVACLQDRISQMEETHYSTSEELQATLQELTDLQDQVKLLQLENEQLETDKAVLYESLCSQTERLEDARSQITRLKYILFGREDISISNEGIPSSTQLEPPDESKSKEYLIQLLRAAHAEYEELSAKKEELAQTVSESKSKMTEIERELETTLESMKSLENKITKLTEEKKQTEISLSESQKTISALNIEISVTKTQLEREQSKVAELMKDREAKSSSEFDVLLRNVRLDKDRLSTQIVKLEQQLALSQLEASKWSDRSKQLEQEMSSMKSQAETIMKDLESRVSVEEEQNKRLLADIAKLEAVVVEAELKCQRHLEDKRELKASLSELQKQINDEKSRTKDVQKELEDIRSKFAQKQEEWKTFQDDLLTTVRVANDFKTEAHEQVERILLKNQKLSDRVAELESEITKLKTSQLNSSSSLESLQRTPIETTPPPVIASVPPSTTPRRSVSVSPVCLLSTPRSPISPIRSVSVVNEPSVIGSSFIKREIPLPRKSLGKYVELRQQQHLSVKSLIESLESKAKSPKMLSSNHSKNNSNSSLAESVSSDKSSTTDGKCDAGGVPVSASIDVVRPTELLVSSPTAAKALGAKKLEGLRHTTIGFPELGVEKKNDPLADLVKGGGSRRNALLKWCQDKTSGYSNIDITNFSSSWNDGLAFCALLHAYLPDRIPYSTLDSRDKRKNFQLAFDAAESVGINCELDINEMISQERPDWHKVMAYVTNIYKHFET